MPRHLIPSEYTATPPSSPRASASPLFTDRAAGTLQVLY